MQDPSSSRSALPVLPPAQTKPVLPQGIHPARPPPQGHKNPALIFPVHAGRFLLKSSCPRFPSISFNTSFAPEIRFPLSASIFQLSDVFHHFRPPPTVPIYRQFFRFLPQIPGMCCQQIALRRCCLLIVPDTVQKSCQLNFSICIRLFVSSKLPSFVQI